MKKSAFEPADGKNRMLERIPDGENGRKNKEQASGHIKTKSLQLDFNSECGPRF